MNRYIKTNASNEIIDIFPETLRSKFDGSEILLDDQWSVEGVHINNKCIFDSLGNKLFTWTGTAVAEIDTSIYFTQHLNAYKLQKRDELFRIINNNFPMNTTRTASTIKTQWEVFKTNASSWNTIEAVDNAFNQAITWLGPNIEIV